MSRKCRAVGGVASCTDLNCPEKRVSGLNFDAVLEKRGVEQKRSFFASLGSFFGGKREVVAVPAVQVEVVSQAEVDRRFAAAAGDLVEKPVVFGVLGEVTRGKNGRLEVLSKDHVSAGGQDVYPFGDLVADVGVAKRLHDADPDKQYQNGECATLAFELWNSNPHVVEYYVLANDDDPEYGIHQFVRLTDGSYADSMGIWSEKAMVEHWRGIDASVRLQVFDDGEPVPPRNRKIRVSNQRLFDAVTDVIDAHFKA